MRSNLLALAVAPLFALHVLATGVSSARAQSTCDDELLAEAAAELLLAGGDPTGAELIDSARRAGSDAPTVHALFVHDGDEARVAPWLERLGERLRAPIACGRARNQERILVVAAPSGGHIESDPTIEGRVRIALAPGFTQPVLFVEDAGGSVERIEPARGYADLPSDLRPPVHVQLVANGPDGPRPVAERTFGAPERRGAPTGSDEPLDARIDAIRTRADASPLRPHRLLATLAHEHAESVCRVRRAAHELEPGRDPSARLGERGIEARHVGEVVARGADTDAAFAALLRSPSHRSALVDARMTDAGAGVAIDERGRACVVVLLAAWPRLVAGR